MIIYTIRLNTEGFLRTPNQRSGHLYNTGYRSPLISTSILIQTMSRQELYSFNNT